jgi:hypothetical protein
LFAWSCDIISTLLVVNYRIFYLGGSFADVPALLCINGAGLDSTVPLSFLHSCSLLHSILNYKGVAVELSSGPVDVPTVDRWYNSWLLPKRVYLYQIIMIILWITSLMGVKVYEESECIGVSENSTVEEL